MDTRRINKRMADRVKLNRRNTNLFLSISLVVVLLLLIALFSLTYKFISTRKNAVINILRDSYSEVSDVSRTNQS